jgi:GH3 auxin-responsive promoter
MVKTALANRAWLLASRPSHSAFEAALGDPDSAQEKILRDFIRKNSDTEFGRLHRLSDVRNAAQFAQRVPVRDYDDIRPWIDRIRLGERNALTSEPVRRLVPTGGSSTGRKLIPYTVSMHVDLNRAIGPWLHDLHRQNPRAFSGPSYWSISPATHINNSEQSSVPIGFDDDSAYLGGWRRPIVASIMAAPAELRDISSIDDWRYVTVLFLLRRRDLSLISVWHPSFMSLLLEAMRNEWEQLVRDVACGSCEVIRRLPMSVAGLVQSRPDRHRADELFRAGPMRLQEIWPGLKVLSCWADGNAAPAAAEIAESMPFVMVQPKGLLATEGVVSIPFGGLHPLAVRSHFLEFEDDAGAIRLASEIERGRQYKVILTTGGGLVRYRLNDRVEVDGLVDKTPSIRFVGRAGMISDLRGEKLSDGFVADVLARLFDERNPRPSFAMLAPDTGADGCWYTLYLNADVSPGSGSMLDQLLSANGQYAYCRRLGQLGTPRLFRLSGDAYGSYCERLRNAGQQLGDIKPVGLSCLDNWSSYLQGNYMDLR